MLNIVLPREEVGFDGYMKSSASRQVQSFDKAFGKERQNGRTAERQNGSTATYTKFT
jgi:hypothetical protein